MATAISTTSLYFYKKGDQVVEGPFIKQDVAKSSSVHLVRYDNRTKTIYFLLRYTSVVINRTEVIILEVGLSGIW